MSGAAKVSQSQVVPLQCYLDVVPYIVNLVDAGAEDFTIDVVRIVVRGSRSVSFKQCVATCCNCSTLLDVVSTPCT